MVGTLRCRRSKVIEFDPEASSAGTLGIEETCDGNLAGVSRFELGLANSESVVLLLHYASTVRATPLS